MRLSTLLRSKTLNQSGIGAVGTMMIMGGLMIVATSTYMLHSAQIKTLQAIKESDIERSIDLAMERILNAVEIDCDWVLNIRDDQRRLYPIIAGNQKDPPYNAGQQPLRRQICPDSGGTNTSCPDDTFTPKDDNNVTALRVGDPMTQGARAFIRVNDQGASKDWVVTEISANLPDIATVDRRRIGTLSVTFDKKGADRIEHKDKVTREIRILARTEQVPALGGAAPYEAITHCATPGTPKSQMIFWHTVDSSANPNNLRAPLCGAGPLAQSCDFGELANKVFSEICSAWQDDDCTRVRAGSSGSCYTCFIQRWDCTQYPSVVRNTTPVNACGNTSLGNPIPQCCANGQPPIAGDCSTQGGAQANCS